jgi:hypothetical protein
MEKEDDLPKSIIVILVILAVAISILGTFTVVSEVSKLNTAPVYRERDNTAQGAKVALQVIDPQTQDSATGKVMFQVVDREGN